VQHPDLGGVKGPGSTANPSGGGASAVKPAVTESSGGGIIYNIPHNITATWINVYFTKAKK
jgi:hypothetical protein